MTPASTNPKYTERGLWNTFRVCGRDDQQGAVAGKYIAEKLTGKKVAVLHDKTTYGQGLADETKKALNAAGVTEALYEGVNVGDKDFSALISKMKEAGVEVIYWGGLHTEGGLIARQSSEAGLKATMMSGDGIASDEFAAIGGPAVEGTLMTFGPDPRQNPAATEAVKKFRDAGFEPEAYTLYSYAAVQIIAAGAKAAGSVDPQAVADAVHKGEKISTVIGDLAYDEKGDRKDADYTVYQWYKADDGKITYKMLQ